MGKIQEELTEEEVMELIRRQEGEFIIHIGPGREGTDADAGIGAL